MIVKIANQIINLDHLSYVTIKTDKVTLFFGFTSGQGATETYESEEEARKAFEGFFDFWFKYQK